MKLVEDFHKLQAVLDRLRSLADPSNAEHCVVEPVHKKAVSLFLESWVIPEIEAVLKDIEREYHARKAAR